MSEPKLPLVARKNIKENEEKVKEDLERIQKAVDLSNEVTLDADYPNLHPFVDKQGYQNRVGDAVVWFTSALANTMENTFKEETAKAALQANWTTGVIRFRLGTLKKGESMYGSTDIENGDLVHTIYSLSNCGDGMDRLLDKLGDADTGLSVKASQNVKEKEEERNEFLQAIHDTVQLSADVTLDVDWTVFAARADKEGYANRVGEAVNWFLGGLKGNIESSFKESDLSRSALQSVWTTGVIKMEEATNKKGESKYNETIPRDGDLAVLVYSFSNTSGTGDDLKGRLTDPASGLPLKSALSIQEKEELKEENFKKIQDAVGLTTDVTLDIEWATFDAILNKQGYNNRVGEAVYDWVLSALANNLHRLCQDEMSKEAVAENWTTGVIRFEENKKISYHACEFSGGDLVIQYKPEGFCSNTGSIGDDIEKKL